MDNIKSPCTGQCLRGQIAFTEIPDLTEHGCKMCKRTMDEIKLWPKYSDAQKFIIINDLWKRTTVPT